MKHIIAAGAALLAISATTSAFAQNKSSLPKFNPNPSMVIKPGGSLVAAGGGNFKPGAGLVAAGGGNFKPGAGIVAAGGGNFKPGAGLVAAGGGNFKPPKY